MLRLYTEFQCPTMSGTGLKVCVRCGGGGGWWLKPIIVFSLVQAEQKATRWDYAKRGVLRQKKI